MNPRTSCCLALFALSAFVAGCGSGASVGGNPVAEPASAKPSASSLTTLSPVVPTPTPTVAATASTAPSPSPTPTGYTLAGVTTCTAAEEAIPGTYTTLDTNGNVVGNTYTEDTTAINSYLVKSYAAAPPTPAPTPTASPQPTASPNPTGTPEKVTIYVGEYAVPAFVGILFPTVYDASATTGCFMLVLQQPGSGTAGQTRRRDAAGGDNSFGIGELANPGYSYTTTDVDAEALTSLTITNLTATSGSGTFALSNGTNGTVTITGSGTIVVQPNATVDLRKRARSVLRDLAIQ